MWEGGFRHRLRTTRTARRQSRNSGSEERRKRRGGKRLTGWALRMRADRFSFVRPSSWPLSERSRLTGGGYFLCHFLCSFLDARFHVWDRPGRGGAKECLQGAAFRLRAGNRECVCGITMISIGRMRLVTNRGTTKQNKKSVAGIVHNQNQDEEKRPSNQTPRPSVSASLRWIGPRTRGCSLYFVLRLGRSRAQRPCSLAAGVLRGADGRRQRDHPAPATVVGAGGNVRRARVELRTLLRRAARSCDARRVQSGSATGCSHGSSLIR